ncbi:hypothetical protein Droror1_Dr00013830 [Drosera rotundifolia]
MAITVMKIVVALVAFLIASSCLATTTATDRKTYIVYMGGLRKEEGLSVAEKHHSMLVETLGDEDLARDLRLHSCGRSFNAFAALLLPHEAEKLSNMPNVVSVFQSKIRKLRTTRSWDFLGMPLHRTPRHYAKESDMIIGMIDSGIYIDAPSFNDDGFGPPPAKWKGECMTGVNFTACNNKVIGGRYYNLNPYYPITPPTPADFDGHGTHTASTAAGIAVSGASFGGLAEGTARGGVPLARLAAYRVCSVGCPDANILAAFDDAIADGVDVISISIGGQSAYPFLEDAMAIGSFHAMEKGILTVAAAGNNGPAASTVDNTAPWMAVVASSNIDRQFRTPVKLGNGYEFTGVSISLSATKKLPLITGAAASLPGENATDCLNLDPAKVEGKIVYCKGSSGADQSVHPLGGAGVINAVDTDLDVPFITELPDAYIDYKLGGQVEKYFNSSDEDATATIYKTFLEKAKAPVISSFSSRGPQFIAPNILKPDISAPGLGILAGYSRLSSTAYNFFISSGTSMATPHVSGTAAYVKSFHPDWSGAAIRSAIMTTAKPIVVNSVENPLDSGSGLLNPVKAVHPGLVYDLSLRSYLQYLCKEGYDSNLIAQLYGSGDKPQVKCSDFPPAMGKDGLNYPSFHLQLQIDQMTYHAAYHRTVTHVEHGPSTYIAKVKEPKGLHVKVVPNVLVFNHMNEKKDFVVKIRGKMKVGMPTIAIAMLEWNDGKHSVRSPIVVYKPTVVG